MAGSCQTLNIETYNSTKEAVKNDPSKGEGNLNRLPNGKTVRRLFPKPVALKLPPTNPKHWVEEIRPLIPWNCFWLR